MKSDQITIGKSEVRKDARSKADGTGLYTADIPMQNKKVGLIIRSPHHHARLCSIDIKRARAMPGVVAILTGQDVPGKKTFGALVEDQPVLALDIVRHVGEPVALVIADNLKYAQQAAEKVMIEYEVLPAVFDPKEAVRPGAPLIHPGGNLLCHFEVSSGDLNMGFLSANEILEDDFSVQRVSPAYMEPENSLARYNGDGSLTVWVNSQKPFEDQKAIAAILGIDTSRVQVMGALVGGAFGGKEDSGMSVLTALAAWSIQGIVQISNTRAESFTAHPKRHPVQFHIKIGAKRDGTLTAMDILADMDTGAYASYGPAVGGLLTEMAPGPYRCPNTRVNTNVVYTNSPYSGAMRGFGAPQAHFALESCMNMLADKLGLDPIEIRRKNILQPGDRLSTQVQMDETSLSLPKCLDILTVERERMKELPVSPGKVSGIGFALAIQSMGLGAKVLDESTHRLEWLPDGRVLIHLGAPDLGQGLTTVAEQMVAETLGLPFDQVITGQLDTLSTPNGGVTCGSRMTYLAGNALMIAAEKLRQNLLEQAAALLNMPVEDLHYVNGTIETMNRSIYPVSEFASRCADIGEPLQAEGKAEFAYPIETTPQHLPIGMPHVKFAFAAQIVRVEVDPELGTVDVKEIESVNDLGRIINRAAVEGQIEGGIAMGIGYALHEDMALKPDGNWVNSFTEYLLPTALDMPGQIRLHLLEIPEASGPYGAKGVAEISLVPTAPAIANAVYEAIHVRVKDLPISAEKVISLMR